MKFLILIYLFFLTSCSSMTESTNNYATVDILDQDYEEKIEVDSNVKSTSHEYGPQMEGGIPIEAESNPVVKKKILGLTFSPAGYLSIGYIGILKKLEQEQIKPHIFVCSELAALICLLYAKYKDLNRVEWAIYSFYSKLKSEQLYSLRWRELFISLINKEFKDQRLETLSTIVGIPVKISPAKVKVYSKGSIADLMKMNIRIAGDYPISVVTEKYINFDKYFQNRGADEIFNIGIVPSGKILNSGDGYLLGIYSKLIYSIKEKLSTQNMLIEIDKTLDSDEDILGIVNIALEKSDLLAQEIQKSIEQER